MPVLEHIDALRLWARKLAQPQPDRKPARLRIEREAHALAEAEGLIQARASYRVVPLERVQGQGVLCVDGEQLPAPWLLPASGELTAVACAVCTIGSALPERVSALFAQRKASLAVGLDALGNEVLHTASRVLQDRLLADVRRQGLSMAGELRSGDPGLALHTQATVLRLAQAHQVGVQVNAHGLMHPLKSTSMVLGVGLALPPARWSRCDACDNRHRCKLVQPEAAA